MRLSLNRKLTIYISSLFLILIISTFSFPYLAGNLGISTAVATKIITIIDSFSSIATIISLIGIILGYGVFSTALVITAKKIISKYGKKYAILWWIKVTEYFSRDILFN